MKKASALFSSATAMACPLCHSPAGEQVRAGIFNDAFGLRLLVTTLPFAVFAALVAWLYLGHSE